MALSGLLTAFRSEPRTHLSLMFVINTTMEITWLSTSLWILFLLFAFNIFLQRRRIHPHLPPSPPAIPIPGHLHLLLKPPFIGNYRIFLKNMVHLFPSLRIHAVLLLSYPLRPLLKNVSPRTTSFLPTGLAGWLAST